MKPVPFEYERPETIAAACELLGHDEDAIIIAGGQSLIPMLAMRLARPTRLVDISKINGLNDIGERAGELIIGCMARHRDVEHNALVARIVPLLSAAMPWVGHAPIRVRGTIGGSLANADPAAEIPLVLTTLGGTVTLTGRAGARSVAAEDFFAGPMMTTIQVDEVLTAVHFPVAPTSGSTGIGFSEVSSRRSDFAMVAAAAQITIDETGQCVACAAGVGGVSDTPQALPEVATMLNGTRLGDDEIGDAAKAATQSLPAMTDPHASATYRLRAATKLVRDVLMAARDDAQSRGGRPR